MMKAEFHEFTFESARCRVQACHAAAETKIAVRIWLSGPRILGGLVRPSISFNLNELRRKAPWPARLSAAERRKLADGLIEAATSRGDSMTREQADELIDQALTGNPAAIKKPDRGRDFVKNDVARSEQETMILS